MLTHREHRERGADGGYRIVVAHVEQAVDPGAVRPARIIQPPAPSLATQQWNGWHLQRLTRRAHTPGDAANAGGVGFDSRTGFITGLVSGSPAADIYVSVRDGS